MMEFPAHMHDTVAENLGMEGTAAYRRSLWAVILNLRPRLDGDKWCVLWGENLQEGISAFGDTPEEAMTNFDYEMRTRHPGRDRSTVYCS